VHQVVADVIAVIVGTPGIMARRFREHIGGCY